MSEPSLDLNKLARELRGERDIADPHALAKALGLTPDRRSFHRQAGGLIVRCVSHEDKTPSMSITRGPDNTVRIRCFGCGFSADAVGLTETVRGLDFREALADLARIAGRWDLIEKLERATEQQQDRVEHRPRPAPAPRPPPPPPPPSVAPEVVDRVFTTLLDACGPLRECPDVARYLQERGVYADADAVGVRGLPPPGIQHAALVEGIARAIGGRQALVDVGLMHTDNELRLADPEHRLVIPWRDAAGRIVSLQRRVIAGSPPRKYTWPRGIPTPREPFGAELLASAWWPGDAVVLVEGAVDALARRRIARHRDERAVVLGIATASTIGTLPFDVLRDRRVILAVDADDAGERLAAKLVEALRDVAGELVRERPTNGKDWGAALARGAA